MSKSQLLKDALTDAKTVREVALANARQTLEENFMPKIKSAFTAMVENEIDEEVDLDEYRELVGGEEEEMGIMTNPPEEEETTDINLDELLAEIELDEAELDEAELDEIDLNEAKDEEDEEAEEDEEIGTMTVAELKALIQDVLADMQGEIGTEEVEDTEELDEIIDLDELFEEEIEEAKKGKMKPMMKKSKEDEKLKEALAQIKSLTDSLNETNLLNAKLLYLNKLFKSHNLSESKKVKIVESFDNATTLKEVKLIFNTLSESLKVTSTSPKAMIRENLGFASKSVGSPKVSKSEILTESNNFVSRLQTLANIKK